MQPAADAAAPKAGLVHRPELDGLRALAVLGVVFFHACSPSAFHRNATPDQAIGAHGVDLFFVLSGLCLSLPMNASKMRNSGDLLTFLRRRVTRIAPPFYIALALFAVLSFTPFGIPSVLGNTPPISMQLGDLLRDAIFVPTLAPMHDMPMWTLGIEMRWYVVFPLVLVLFYRSKIAFLLTFALSFFVYFAGGPGDCAYLPAFMLGIVAAYFVKRDSRINRIWPYLFVVAFVVGVEQQRLANAIDHGSVVWDVACLALVSSVTTNAWLRRAFSSRPLVAIGIASYSIYLVHQPFLEALVWAGVPPAVAAVAGVVAGGVFWYAIERPLCSSASRRAIDLALVRAYHALTFQRLRKSAPALSIAAGAE